MEKITRMRSLQMGPRMVRLDTVWEAKHRGGSGKFWTQGIPYRSHCELEDARVSIISFH